MWVNRNKFTQIRAGKANGEIVPAQTYNSDV